MNDYIEIGSAPCDEACVQVDPHKDYLPAMRAEFNRFIDLIRKKLGSEPEGARLQVKSNPHDFGTYLEVACYYDDENEEAKTYAYLCESDAPKTWDDDKPLEKRDIEVNVSATVLNTITVQAPTKHAAERLAKQQFGKQLRAAKLDFENNEVEAFAE